MNTLSRSSSVFPLPAVSLTHSVNSSGRMGLFVDPANCSCGGCEDYCRSAPAELPAPLTPIRTPKADVSIGPPALRRAAKADVSIGPLSFRPALQDISEDESSVALPAMPMPSVALGRAPANQVRINGEWVASDSLAALAAATTSSSSAATTSSSSSLPAPPPLRHVDAFSSPAPAAAPQSSEDEMEDICGRLRYVRASLQAQQDEVYSVEARSHDEMAAQDQEFEELDRKIMAIEQLLTAFGSFFRTR